MHSKEKCKFAIKLADDSIFTHMETSLNNCSLKERKHI